jgi:hypothetical protein
VPPVPAAGVPDKVAVPLACAAKLTPEGRDPVSAIVDVGLPVEVTVKLPEDPTVKVVEEAEAMAGAKSTVKVNDCVAFGLTPLVALIVIGKDPPCVGVPDRVAVPSPLSMKLTPLGKVPVSESDGAGKAAVVTVKLFDEPSMKEVELAEVIAGAWSTVRVKD